MRIRYKLAALGLLFVAAAAVDGSIANGAVVEERVAYLITDQHGKDWQVFDTVEREDEILTALRLENERLRKEVDRLDDPLQPSLYELLESRPRCFEDEHVVVVIGQVQPDDGVEPDVDWASIGEDIGKVACIAADDLAYDDSRFNG